MIYTRIAFRLTATRNESRHIFRADYVMSHDIRVNLICSVLFVGRESVQSCQTLFAFRFVCGHRITAHEQNVVKLFGICNTMLLHPSGNLKLKHILIMENDYNVMTCTRYLSHKCTFHIYAPFRKGINLRAY